MAADVFAMERKRTSSRTIARLLPGDRPIPLLTLLNFAYESSRGSGLRWKLHPADRIAERHRLTPPSWPVPSLTPIALSNPKAVQAVPTNPAIRERRVRGRRARPLADLADLHRLSRHWRRRREPHGGGHPVARNRGPIPPGSPGGSVRRRPGDRSSRHAPYAFQASEISDIIAYLESLKAGQ